MSYPSGWMPLNFLDDRQTETPPPTTTTTSTAAVTSTDNDHGRGARPIRRRSRASRRTPTTLLNTDTTNFRAMVQQFTGGPAAMSHVTTPAGRFDFTEHISGHLPPNIQYPNQMQQGLFLGGDHMLQSRGGGGVSPHAPPGSSSTNENLYYNNYRL